MAKKAKQIKIRTIEDIFKHLTEENKERFFMDLGLYIHYAIDAKKRWPDVKFKHMIWKDDGVHKITGILVNGQRIEIEGKNKLE